MPTFTRNGEPMPAGEFLGLDGETRHPVACLTLWTDEELAAEGIERAPDPEPDPLAQAKAERLRAIEAAYDARRQRFPCVLGGQAEHLQLRDGSNDARNWMILQRRADRAIAAGHGAVTCPTPIRAESNAEHAATFQEIADLLEAMEDWGAGLMATCWAKKDAVTAAETVEAVLAVDPATGWEA